MRRLGQALALLACALSGVVVASVLADVSPASLVATTSGAATTGPVPTGTTPTTTEPDPLIAPGVLVGGVAVGGLSPDAATDAVRAAFTRPLVVVVGGRKLQPTPSVLGATAYVKPAIERARRATPGARVQLYVRVRGASVRAYVARVARRFDRAPVDARLTLRGLRPVVTRDRAGRTLDRPESVRAIVGRLRANSRQPVGLRLRTTRPAVTRASFGPVIVIRRESKRLFLYHGMRLRRVFGVATGQASYPTPLGRFSVVVKWRNPWWYPPDSDWARGLSPVPPGPGNPLGTRWMGISAPGVGIHGTPDAASIGYSASHGCVRMRIPEAEWLFERVWIGTPVFIVAA